MISNYVIQRGWTASLIHSSIIDNVYNSILYCFPIHRPIILVSIGYIILKSTEKKKPTHLVLP